jgi:2-oxoglutarate ferredoxin oxidoreductase subunit delta
MLAEINSTEPPQVEESQESTSKQPKGRASKKFRVNIYDAWCKKCGICVEFCPKGVLTADELGTPHPTHQEKCIGCTQCVLHCPDFAITVSEEDEEQDK